MALYCKENASNTILIIRTENLENYTDYIIEVRIGGYHWLVNHRYSEFFELNEQLTAHNGLEKKLLPPKKTFGNTADSFIQKRRSGLERYLQLLLKHFERIPFELAAFLEFPKYEINGVTQILAETLFSRGDSLLEKESTCSMDPLQLHAITTRLTKPETVVSSSRRDIGHILDFVTQLQKLRIIGTDKAVGNSNINMNNLEFSLSMFKSIKYLELVKCDITRISGIDHVRQNVEKLKLKKSVTSVQEFITHNAVYWEDGNEGGDDSRSSVIWPQLAWVDMSENDISELPTAMRYFERMTYLDLHDNYLQDIENLQAVSYLTHLDVSMNRIERLNDLHLRLGNVKTINLSGNKLETLESFSKLYSLEYLDVSNNQISQVVELRCLGSLPLLETLIITGNPVTVVPDFRIQVLKIFDSRAKEVSLDNKKATEMELDTVAVLIALDRAKQSASVSQQPTQEPPAEPVAALGAALAPLHVNENSPGLSSPELSAPVLQEKLQALSQSPRSNPRPDQLDQSGQSGSLPHVPNTRFDSPFNSPTRSSAESDQQFHSLSASPNDGDIVDGSTNDLAQDLPAEKDRSPPDGASNNHDIDRALTSSYAGSDVSSPSTTYSVDTDNHHTDLSVNEQTADTVTTEPIEADQVEPAGESSMEMADYQVSPETVDTQVPEMSEDMNGVDRPPLSPRNVSIAVVDHLEKCLSSLPNTIKLRDGPLVRLTHIDGEDLLNMFNSESLFRRVGDGKEELCHAMWTSLATYDYPDVEQPCLVLLSNQATYFVRAGKDHGKYTVKNIMHRNLQEVAIGAYHQSVRFGGETERDYYCCITRDPSLVHIFVTRIAFIVDTDFVKSPSIDQSSDIEDDEDEGSIYDTKQTSSEPGHPSGVHFIHMEEQSVIDLREFILCSSRSDGGEDLPLLSVAYIYLHIENDLHPCTMVLTKDAIYLIQEMYAYYPIPKCAQSFPVTEPYVLERTVDVAEVANTAFDEQHLRLELALADEQLTVEFCSLAIAESFLSSYASSISQ